MRLCSIKNEQLTRFQDEISCSCLLNNYVKATSLGDQAETILLPDLTRYQELLKNKVKKGKQCQIAANCTQNKISKLCLKCNKTVCGKCTTSELSECVICATTQIRNIFQFCVQFLPFPLNKTRDVEAVIFQTLPFPFPHLSLSLPPTKNEKTTVDNFFKLLWVCSLLSPTLYHFEKKNTFIYCYYVTYFT